MAPISSGRAARTNTPPRLRSRVTRVSRCFQDGIRSLTGTATSWRRGARRPPASASGEGGAPEAVSAPGGGWVAVAPGGGWVAVARGGGWVVVARGGGWVAVARGG